MVIVDCTAWERLFCKKIARPKSYSCVSKKEVAIIWKWQKKQKLLRGSKVRGQEYTGMNPTSEADKSVFASGQNCLYLRLPQTELILFLGQINHFGKEEEAE